VRVNAWTALEQTMRGAGITWSDIGNWIESAVVPDDGKYTETEMQEFAQAVRAEGVEEGIKIGMVRARNGNGFTLPSTAIMAEYCHQRLARLKDDKQRDFVSDMYLITQRGITLSLGRIGYLASIYIQIGGKI